MSEQHLCSEPGCPVEVGVEGAYCAHHYMHSAADGECGPDCPPPGGTALAEPSKGAYRPDCTGASNCPAGQHIHGCYADFGSCDNPAEHWQQMTPSGDQGASS